MSRRRYLSTDISLDGELNKLARDNGDFVALFYSWLIPHVKDNCTLAGTPEEIKGQVVPLRTDIEVGQIVQVLNTLHAAKLIKWDKSQSCIFFHPKKFYEYQSYIPIDDQIEGCKLQGLDWAKLFPDKAEKHGLNVAENSDKQRQPHKPNLNANFDDKVEAVVALLPTKNSKNARKIVEEAISMHPKLPLEIVRLSMREVLDYYNKPEHKNRTDWASLFARKLNWVAETYDDNESRPSYDDIVQQREIMKQKLLEQESK